MEMRKKSPRNLPGQLTLWLTLSLLLAAFGFSAQASDLGLTEADCRCCHGPTLADRHHLLVNSGGLECLSCHEMVYDQTNLMYIPVVTRDCLQCHTGSLADRHHALVDEVTYDCFSCHTLIWDPVALSYRPVLDLPCPASQPSDALASVNGTVTDAGGTGLGWARVATADGSFSALSTATGSYQLAELPDGDYLLTASLDGYVSASQAVTISNGQSALVAFVLTPVVNPGSITGVVRDSNLNPVQGATVASENGLLSTLTGTNGTFTLSNVLAGSYAVTAAKTGYAAHNQTLTVFAGQELSADFVLAELPVEICADSIDNDGNGLTDCADAACADTTDCLPPAAEICGDGIDNDSNGLTDCSDPECMGTGSCPPPAVEICGDGLDNNGDGLLDCADPLCSASTSCLHENCTDGIDNDANGLIDCADPACASTSKCLAPPVEICDDGLDNDANGMVDCADGKCASKSICAPPVIEELCDNGMDDNGDGYTDCADTQCMDRTVCLKEICSNSLDDDNDGKTDCADPDCGSEPFCAIPEPLTFSARASDSEYRYGAEKAGDGDMNSRWWVDKGEDQWLRLDLGGIYTVDKVVIRWHGEYAEDYKIKLSNDARYWRTVKEIDNSDGGHDTLTFAPSEARYILIDCERANHDGFSIYEVEVHEPSLSGSTDTSGNEPSTGQSSLPSAPSNANLALNQPARSSDAEYRNDSAKAVDGDMSSRWSAGSYRDEWLRVDLGTITTVGQVVIHWHRDFAEDYQVKVSRDGYHWTTVMEINHGNGGLDAIAFASREARYVLIDCEEASSDSSSSDSGGFSIYELEVYRQ